MRRTLQTLAALLVALPVAGSSHLARGQTDGDASDEYTLPDLAGDPSSRDLGGAVEGGETRVEGDRHVVEKGDTLWDLSSKYLGSPWYWPKVWSFNPQIENPHWIYPGDEVRFGQAIEGQEAAVVAATPAAAEGEPLMEDEVSIAGTIGYRGHGSQQVARVGFATDEELGRAGRIAKSWEEKELLYEGDRIYLEMDRRDAAREGTKYVIFRIERAIQHPDSGSSLGSVIRILGSAKVVDANPKQRYVTAMIDRATMEISRGDMVGPVGVQLSHQVHRIENARDVAGVIAGTMDDDVAELAQGHFVFLDKGLTHGVAKGNTFSVVRATDGLDDDGFTPRYDDELPAERIGEVMVVEARPEASVALVVSSLRELRQGDRVEMRATIAER